MATPPSQKYRQISFSLTGGNAPDEMFTFVIRPEELSREEPTRITPQQTLGGAWVDVFGAGISTISLSGHNGWRGGLLSSGEDLFTSLRTTVYQGWINRRAGLLASGQDPAQVELIFTDNLDSIRVVVAPTRFSLRRSRSRPLLMMYQIQLLVLGDAETPLTIADQIIDALSNPLRWIEGQLGLTGIVGTLGSLQGYVTQVSNVIGAVKVGVQQLLNCLTGVLSAVATVASDTQGAFTGGDGLLLTMGIRIAQAASNGFAALAADTTLSTSDRITVMTAASACNDAACTMANAFDANASFTLLTPLFGASTCSSTAGGDQASVFMATGTSPFDSLLSVDAPPITVTTSAQAALASLQGDPINLIGQNAAIGAAFSAVAAGVQVAA